MRKHYVIGNWKMNGRLATNKPLLEAIRSAADSLEGLECGVCVPYPYLAQAQQLLTGSRVKWGAQNVSHYDAGAFTGAIAGGMVADFGAKYVICGHSERRGVFAESDDLAAEKFAAAQRHGLFPIFCVGETLEEREAGQTESVVARQLDALLKRCGIESMRQSILAYEPVWAIGTGKTATPQAAQAVHEFLRARIGQFNASLAKELSILYGGSVKAANAYDLFRQLDVDGGLIGGASLIADDFIGICKAAHECALLE